MSEKKSPYGRFSIEDVQEAEYDSFIIQIGYEVFGEGNYYAFSKDRVDYFYPQIISGLRDILKNGTEDEKDDTMRAICNLRVIPLRIQ